MKYYDEYQKLLRYKYGYHSFLIIIVLSVINFNLTLFMDTQWAETKYLEFMLLLFFAAGYSIVMNVYKGSYFTRHQSVKMYSVFFLLGLVNLYLSSSPYSPLIKDGLITSNSIMFVNALIFISMPIAFLSRIVVEKRLNSDDD